MAVRSPLITVMANAALKAARGLQRDFGEVEQLQVSRKGPADFVSNADRAAEQVLVAELSKARPRYGFLLEEGGEIAGADTSNRWVIDPLDGTTNFLHGVPHFAISIGLERDGQPFAGVVYDPLRDEMFWAESGGGAFLNNRRLRVSSRKVFADALVATGMPFKGRVMHPAYPYMLDSVWGQTAGVRRFGCASLDLVYVAAGRFDGFFEFALSPWDISAGIALVREAGGAVTDPQGGTQGLAHGDVLASNTHLHGDLKAALEDGVRRVPTESLPSAT
ncbi:MAG: inositol monophosphatase [Alphaproteobacteria bacterium]|nr:inositol monophosphatase [Alphaproteobacteria bacterium]